MNWIKILYILGAILFGIQTILLANPIPGVEPRLMLLITGVMGFLSTSITTVYQYADKGVNDKLTISGWIMVTLSILGGVNEVLNLFELTDSLSHLLTWLVTVVSLIIQMVSRILSNEIYGK